MQVNTVCVFLLWYLLIYVLLNGVVRKTLVKTINPSAELCIGNLSNKVRSIAASPNLLSTFCVS